MTLSLTHSTLDAHSRKIRLILGECNLKFVLQEEAYWEQQEDFLLLNPAGEVPVLQDEEGFIIAGQYPISEYLEERLNRDKNASLMGKTVELRAETRRLVDWFDRIFYAEVTQVLTYEKYFKRLEGKGWPDTKVFHQSCRQLHYHLEMIESLIERTDWLGGEHFTLADISAAAQLSVIDYFGDMPWKDHPKARHWYRLIKSRPSMRPLLKDRVRGVTPPDHYDNPDF